MSASVPVPLRPESGNNGGSRESSEFEFVNVSGKPSSQLSPGTKNPHQVPMSPGSISPNPKQVLPSSVNTPQLISPSARPSSGMNPLLMSSNLPTTGPGLVASSLVNQPSSLTAPSFGPTPPATSTSTLQAPTSSAQSSMSKSVSAPVNMYPDQTSVSTVVAESPPNPGMFGWVKGSGFLSKVVEKTKSVTENVITTLDPQMKEFIHSGGDVEVIVSSDKEDKVVPIRNAFQKVFGNATVYGLPSKSLSIAEQPVGFASAKQAAQERINTLRKSGTIGPATVVVSVENFLYEVNEDLWMDMSCLLLSDPQRKISLQSFSQPTNVAASYVEKLREGTPENYPKQWSGFAVTIGQVMGEEMNVPPGSWQEAVSGVHRRQLLSLAGEALAGMYRRQLLAKVEQI